LVAAQFGYRIESLGTSTDRRTGKVVQVTQLRAVRNASKMAAGIQASSRALDVLLHFEIYCLSAIRSEVQIQDQKVATCHVRSQTCQLDSHGGDSCDAVLVPALA
jgi:hypothetical protein